MSEPKAESDAFAYRHVDNGSVTVQSRGVACDDRAPRRTGGLFRVCKHDLRVFPASSTPPATTDGGA